MLGQKFLPFRCINGGRLYSAFRAEKRSREIPVLDRPIGTTKEPSALDNMGIDTRTRAQKKADFQNYDLHLKRREELKAEFAKSSFDQVYKFRDTAGKFFQAPRSYFRSDKALYMPNFWGRTLVTPNPTGTTAVLKGRLSIVRVFTSVVGEEQTRTWWEDKKPKEDGFNLVDVNIPETLVKEWIVKMVIPSIKKTIPEERWTRYFISRKGVTKDLRNSILLDNVYSGYIYVVDKDCKIRWAGCGDATEEERNTLWKVMNALKKK